VLNEHLLEQAAEAGCLVSRPARVTDVALRPFDNRVRWTDPGGAHEAAATWVLDASGRACMLGTQQGMVRPNKRHPISAIVGRWTGDLDLDGPSFDPDTEFAHGPAVARRLCTNHFQGYGYRVRVQPSGGRIANAERGLKVSVLYDRRVVDLSGQSDVGDAYSSFLSGLPAVRQLLHRANLPRQRLEVVPQVAYDLDQVAGPGWALMGSAAGYADPCGSGAADNVARTVGATLRLVVDQLDGKPVAQDIDRYVADFRRSWSRSFEARHRDRYLLCGDFDLYWPALLMDRALYMLAEVAPRSRASGRAIGRFPFVGPRGTLRWLLMRSYSTRLRKLARRRMWTGHYGRRNAGQRLHFRADLGAGSLWTLARGLGGWTLREFEDLGLWAAYLADRWRGSKTLAEGADLATLPEGIETVGSRDG